jgi:hypothetical protein
MFHRCGATHAIADSALKAMSGTACGKLAAVASSAHVVRTAVTPGRYRRRTAMDGTVISLIRTTF